jgi:hypothetical protein
MPDQAIDHDGSNDPTRTARLVGCSVTGPKHLRSDDPCEDAWTGRSLPDGQIVIAVGDGLGSATHARRGSALATHEAAATLEAAVAGTTTLGRNSAEQSIERAFVTARTALSDEAEQMGVPVSALNTTLIALVAGPSGVAAAAVGDGGVAGQVDESYRQLLPREDTEYAEQTTPLQSNRWRESYRFRYHDGVDGVAVFSDGVDPWAWSGSDSVDDTFFEQVFTHVRSKDASVDATRGLAAHLDSDHFRQYSEDDKTLVVGVIGYPQRTTAGSDSNSSPFLRRLVTGWECANVLIEALSTRWVDDSDDDASSGDGRPPSDA